jgi:hypothetical protein
MFTPDFYLPALDLYVELTTLKQSLVTQKNRKLRRLRELYPDVKITLLYKRDFDRLLAKYGAGPLAQAREKVVGREVTLFGKVNYNEYSDQLEFVVNETSPEKVGGMENLKHWMTRREKAFGLEAIGILALWQLGTDPVAFVLLTGLVFFAWGEIYSLFPSTCTDTFGSKFAAANAGALYTAKGTASLLVPLSSVLVAATGGWHAVFIVAAVMNAVAALMAWFVLRPMRLARYRKAESEAAAMPPSAEGLAA